MTNADIAYNFELLAALMELNDEDSFKVKAYLKAARLIKKLPVELQHIKREEIFQLPGVGKAIGNKILEQLATGTMEKLDEHVSNAPQGILEMMSVKGLGTQKIKLIWKELGITSINDLLEACNSNRLSPLKGFGQKTQQNIKVALEFYLQSRDAFLLATVLDFVIAFDNTLRSTFSPDNFLLTGEILQQSDIIHTVQWVTDAGDDVLEKIAGLYHLNPSHKDGKKIYTAQNGIRMEFLQYPAEMLIAKQFELSCTPHFFKTFIEKYKTGNVSSREQIFLQHNLQPIPPFLTNNIKWIDAAAQQAIPEVITTHDIKGIIHCHSNWSDGADRVEDIAAELIGNGLEYLVLTDHSKSAFYAEGLSEQKVLAQQQQIDELNKKLYPFRIFKGIECDILNDGSLDYGNEILKTFEVVIASVHSNLRMQPDAATQRIIKAVENPYTSILGHLTGRLLLLRNGYPVDHKKIIDACAANHVVIELNANPRRLDIDWRYMEYALQKEVLISINPDAHFVKGLYDIRFGVLAAQKAGLTKAQNLSSYSTAQLQNFIDRQSEKRI